MFLSEYFIPSKRKHFLIKQKECNHKIVTFLSWKLKKYTV